MFITVYNWDVVLDLLYLRVKKPPKHFKLWKFELCPIKLRPKHIHLWATNKLLKIGVYNGISNTDIIFRAVILVSTFPIPFFNLLYFLVWAEKQILSMWSVWAFLPPLYFSAFIFFSGYKSKLDCAPAACQDTSVQI